MRTVLLRLEGPMQSWGLTSRFDDRDSALEPTKSGVIGLCAAALGLARDDTRSLARLASLTMAVRVDRQGSLARDFQTAGGGRFAGEDYGVYKASGDAGDTVTSPRAYLADASFLVGLGGDAELVGEVASALQSPHWPLALGRRAFAPAAPIFAGIVDGLPEEAVRTATDPPSRCDKRRRMVVEVREGGAPRMDQPVSFKSDERRFAVRFVESRAWERPEQPALAEGA